MIIIGCLIELPKNQHALPSTTIVSPKTQEELIKNLKRNTGSKISYFKNGVCQGVAFQDVSHGIYYPAVSIYSGSVFVAFGPPFTQFIPPFQVHPFKFALDLPPPLHVALQNNDNYLNFPIVKIFLFYFFILFFYFIFLFYFFIF